MEEALDLLNCVAQSPYDQDKCVGLLQVLRQCVLCVLVDMGLLRIVKFMILLWKRLVIGR
jgi:hypothetical protein